MHYLPSLKKTFQRSFPQLYYNLIQRPRRAFRFRTEKRLAQGVTLSRSQHKSILFYTTQKCASRYVGGILSRLAMDVGMPTVDYDAYLVMTKVPKDRNPFSVLGKQAIAFPPRGYFFGPIGRFHEIPQFEDFSTVLQLRDPRDVLTSLYFSTAYSHALISKKLVKRRKEALNMPIDTYVLKQAEQYRSIYSGYAQELLHKSSVHFLRYEEMVGDFDTWLAKLSQHVELDQNPILLQEIRNEANFDVGLEDKYAQKRQVTPGDHLRKLKPETISQLNTIFGDLLGLFGYQQ